MSHTEKSGVSRREVLKIAGVAAAASALAGVVLPHVHAAEDNTIQVALVGCGGRGTGAAENALNVARTAQSSSSPWPTSSRIDSNDSYQRLQEQVLNNRWTCPKDRKFIGFDAYKKAMDCLKPGDVVIFATPPAFRWVHFGYAIEKGLNVFMEKPVTVDGPTSKKMLKLGRGIGEEEPEGRRRPDVPALRRPRGTVRADQGRADRRHHPAAGVPDRRADRRRDSPQAAAGHADRRHQRADYQIHRFHSFLWASGGCFSDFLIHNIDECCWMKDAWPVEAQGDRRPALPRRPTSTRTSTPTRSSTPSPTAPS